MLKFTILNGYGAGKKAGHHTEVYDTTLAEDVARATAEFERLLAEGRVAVFEETRGEGGVAVTEVPVGREGEVTFILPMQGG